MTNDKFKPVMNGQKYVPKIYEQFVLGNQFEQNQAVADSYTAEVNVYGNLGKGYGPCLTYNPNCQCSLEELQRQRLILENREVEERIRRENGENTQQEVNQLREELQQRIAERDSRPDTTIDDYNQLIRQRDNLRDEKGNLERECNEVRQTIAELNNQLVQKDNQIQRLNQQIGNLSNQNTPAMPQMRQPREIGWLNRVSLVRFATAEELQDRPYAQLLTEPNSSLIWFPGTDVTIDGITKRAEFIQLNIELFELLNYMVNIR